MKIGYQEKSRGKPNDMEEERTWMIQPADAENEDLIGSRRYELYDAKLPKIKRVQKSAKYLRVG